MLPLWILQRTTFVVIIFLCWIPLDLYIRKISSRRSNNFPDRYPSSITANSNRQKQVNVTAPTPPPSTTSSGSLSPKPAASSSSMSSGQQTQGHDHQPLRDASASPSKPPLPATTLSIHNSSQKQVYRDGVDTLSSPQGRYHLPPSVQTKSKTRPFFYPSASTSLSTPSSPSGGTTLTYHLITKHLALLAVIPTAVYEERKGLVEYNVVFFREGVQEICDVEDEVRGSGSWFHAHTSSFLLLLLCCIALYRPSRY